MESKYSNAEIIAKNEELKNEVLRLKEFTKVCNSRHKHHEHTQDDHDNLLETVIETQNKLCETQKCMTESFKSFSDFISKHEPTLDLVEKTLTTLSGIKYAIGWLAAIIGGLSIILGGFIAVWMYSLPLPEIMEALGK